MIKVNKSQVISNLTAMIKNDKNITKSRQVKNFLKLVKKSNLNNYIVRVSSNGNYNIGDIGEALVLRYLRIDKEDNNHEIKTLVKNSPNELINNNVKIVYLLVLSQDSKKDKVKNGLYKLDASYILNKTIRKKMLDILPLKRVCSVSSVAIQWKKRKVNYG